MATHKRTAVCFDGIVSEVSASDYFSPIRCRVANFFANIDGSLGDSLGGRSSGDLRSFTTLLLKSIRELEGL